MALILNIETATPVLSVALSRDGKTIASRTEDTGNSHAEMVTLLISEIMEEMNLTYDHLDAVAVSKGPGSYTGLRIGVSTAKGFCYAKEIPLIAVDTLQAMALGMAEKQNPQDQNTLFCPMIDARRMEVYDAFYDVENQLVREVQATIVDENTYQKELENKMIVFGGNGVGKCREVIQSPNARFLTDFIPSAKYMAPLAEKAYLEKQFEDVAYFEPNYFKAYIAGKPKVKGLYS